MIHQPHKIMDKSHNTIPLIQLISSPDLKSFPLKRLGQILPHFGGMVLGWSLFKIMSDDSALQMK